MGTAWARPIIQYKVHHYNVNGESHSDFSELIIHKGTVMQKLLFWLTPGLEDDSSSIQ